MPVFFALKGTEPSLAIVIVEARWRYYPKLWIGSVKKAAYPFA